MNDDRPEPERWVTAAQLAERMGVSQSTIKRWVRDGAPSETWGLRARRFLPSQVMGWARARGMGEPWPPVQSDEQEQ